MISAFDKPHCKKQIYMCSIEHTTFNSSTTFQAWRHEYLIQEVIAKHSVETISVCRCNNKTLEDSTTIYKGNVMQFNQFIHKFIQDESGVSALEYGLLAALVALALVTGAGILGTDLSNFFSAVGAKITTYSPK
jgi:pilus assembly protein Flp/PilA